MQISEITRRDLIDYLLLRKPPFNGRLDEISFLKRIWNLSSMPSTDSRFSNAEGDIWQHMVNNYDWDNSYLLKEYLELLNCDDNTFLKFIENTIHPVVLSDEKVLDESVAEFNKRLNPDGFSLEINSYISSHPIYLAKKISSNKILQSGHSYEVVLSFAGEDREYVEKVSAFLKANGVKFFYDKYEEVSLWGKDLAEHLDKVYRGSARYCVMFISKHYAEKVWTNHERKSALARAIEEKEEYILPVRFDDTEIPGVRPTLGYIKLDNIAPEKLGELILQKLGRIV